MKGQEVNLPASSGRLGTGRFIGLALRATVPWLLLLVGGRLLWGLTGSWGSWTGSALWWLSYTSAHIGFCLPFLLFASGVALADTVGRSSRKARTGIGVGLVFAALAYVFVAWVNPLVEHEYLTSSGVATAERLRFGPETPTGLLRNLRFVEDNPPREYSLNVEAPGQYPPNVLRWDLHHPAAMAVFGLANMLLGALAARLTADLRRPRRRNARIAIGVLGGMAFFVCVMFASPIEPFLRDGTLRSGALSAWAPLALPLTEALLLCYLIRRRR